jgi:hypothetical protein
LLFLIAIMLLCGGVQLLAQDQPAPTPSVNGPEPAPAAGGPQANVGPYAIPKKKDQPPPAPPAEKPSKIEGLPAYSIRVNVPLVEIPVSVTTKEGQFISSLQKDNFRVYEDGVPQTISNFAVSQAPITAVLLVEFASTNYAFVIDALRALTASPIPSRKTTGWQSSPMILSRRRYWISRRTRERFSAP